MKVCFVGTGSIGKRHIKNFSTVCIKNDIDLVVHALRNTSTELSKDILSIVNKEIFSIEDMDSQYDAIFITNPTNMHYETINDLKNKSNNFFVEKPLFETYKKNIELLNLPNNNIYYIACPLRFTRVLMEARELSQKEKIYCARAISSSYLPEWRPNVDYTQVYSANKEQGGGVPIDLIHEWDYITSFFGFPQKVSMMAGKYSHLNITSEDLAIYIAKYNDKLVEVHLDYFGRDKKRYIEFFTQKGTYRFDIINYSISFNNEIIKRINEDPNDKYMREMNYFFDLILGKANNINSISNAINVLKIAQCEGY